MFISKLLVSLLVISSALAESVNINEIVDNLLENARALAILKGQDKIRLNDIHKTFDTTIFGMTITGKLDAIGGIAQNPTTLHRTGDAVMSTEGNILKLHASFGLTVLRVDFEKYHFTYLTLASEGKFSASIAENSVSAKIGVERTGDKCNTVLDYARVDSLGGLKVEFSDPGVMGKLGNLILNWVLTYFNDTIKVLLNQHLEQLVRDALAKADICSKLPH